MAPGFTPLVPLQPLVVEEFTSRLVAALPDQTSDDFPAPSPLLLPEFSAGVTHKRISMMGRRRMQIVKAFARGVDMVTYTYSDELTRTAVVNYISDTLDFLARNAFVDVVVSAEGEDDSLMGEVDLST
jgi:hypothetical protein